MAAGRVAVTWAALVLVAIAVVGGPSARANTLAGDASSDWTVYHGDPAGLGLSRTVKSVDTAHAAWTSPALDGQLYGEPLVFSHDVYVATENDTVYALSSTSGRVEWAKHLARPVPSSLLPCGDISPSVGITGTPVIDPTRNEIFVVADELRNARPAHVLVGLNTASGALEMQRVIDPPGADPAALLQRTGLTLDKGRVVFGMGGNYGDCSTYRGRVVSVAENGSNREYFTVDSAPGEREGAVWMGGAAPVVSASGDVWVSTGNGSVYSSSQRYDGSDSVLELSPSMHLLQYFAPTTWPSNNAQDLDMTTAPILLASGQVVLTGKSRIVYLLDGTHLGGIGHQETSLDDACASDIDGGSAVVGMTVYLPCLSGTVALRVGHSPPSLRILWSASSGGGPPIVAAGLVWTIGQDGVIYGLDPATGAVRQHATIGLALANHFPTPSVGDSLLLVPSSNRVVAFRAR